MAEKDFFTYFLEEEDRIFKNIRAYDEFQKERGEFLCRYIIREFTDRVAYYQVYEETKRKYLLYWVLGESPYPEWGRSVKLWKRQVEEEIKGRDSFEKWWTNEKIRNAQTILNRKQ